MASGFHIEKLSDEFGQYTLVLKCAECGHERTADPHTLARLPSKRDAGATMEIKKQEGYF